MTDLFHTNCPHCGQAMPDQSETSFNAFWKTVPHKIGVADAEKAWAKLSTQERQQAAAKVRTFYAWFKRENPQASPLHPCRYLSKRRWLDEAMQAQPKDSHAGEKLAAQAIISGKDFLCRNITPALGRRLVESGSVTYEQCCTVGVL